MKISGATPVLFVDRVEPTRDFFRKAGFEVAVEIPAGGAVGFALLAKDGFQVMVETRGNENELPGVQKLSMQSRHAFVFIEVDDLDAVIAAFKDAKILAERHKTFYGSEEITYEEPAGHMVTFAKFDRP